MVLVYLAIDTIRLDATDMRIEALAQLVCHKLYHLILDRIALSLLCHLLHVGTVLAEFLVFILAGTAASVLIACQQTVYHRVGIASDGRSEVGVVFKSQSVVTYIMGGILCLHH